MPGFKADVVHVTGLVELQKALKALDGESQKMLRVVLNEIGETIAAGARQRIPRKTGAARGSVKTASGQREGKVQEGSAKAPYAAFLDYGGTVGRGHEPRKGGGAIKRPFVKDGRFLYETYRRNQVGIQAALEDRLQKLVKSVGLEVTEE